MKIEISPQFRAVLLVLVLALAISTRGASAKSSHWPRVYVDASLVKDLVSAPVPSYPAEAVKKGWSGLGVFEVQFRGDGTVKNVVPVLTTEHQLLDEAARASLLQWRAKPHTQSSARLTMHFTSDYHPVTLDPQDEYALKNIPVHPQPTYPYEARRLGHVGGGLFVMRFRPDGSMKQVVALESTGHAELDQVCIATFMRWRCLPGSLTSAYLPISFILGR